MLNANLACRIVTGWRSWLDKNGGPTFEAGAAPQPPAQVVSALQRHCLSQVTRQGVLEWPETHQLSQSSASCLEVAL